MLHRKTIAAAAAALLAAVLLCGCVNVRPGYEASVTPGPTQAPTDAPEASVLPTEAVTPAPTEYVKPTYIPGESVDDMGAVITGADHFYRYIKFTDLIVYEEDGDTFLDGMVQNSYSRPLVCAVDIVYRDEGGGELARASLQTRDGNYMLVLAPGENVVFAQILTDMSLVGMEYELEFDTTSGVHPA